MDVLVTVIFGVSMFIVGVLLGNYDKKKSRPKTAGDLRIYTDGGEDYMFLELYPECKDIRNDKQIILNVNYKG